MNLIKSAFRQIRSRKNRANVGTSHGLASIPGRELILDYLCAHYTFWSALDIGCGEGDFFHYLSQKGIQVEGHGLDLLEPYQVKEKEFIYHQIDFMDYISYHSLVDRGFDLVFSSHTIEHNSNTESFLKRFFACCKPGGDFCLIWPPPKPRIVGGHVHIFNMGLMIYNMVRLGIDCRNVAMLKSGYNLAIIGKYRTFDLPQLPYNKHEIDLLRDFFPFSAKQGFDGDSPPGLIDLVTQR